MSGSQTPEWLAKALAEAHDPQPQDVVTDPAEVSPGDLCVVRPFDRSAAVGRLFVVTDTGDGWCEGMLAGADTELATEVDALLAPQVTGLGYELAVHSRFHGPIWITQVTRRVGSIEPAVLEDLDRLAWNDEADVSTPVGMPLQPARIDPRYPALEALSTELDQLTDHCRRRRHELSEPTLDPLLGDVRVLRELLREPGWEAALRRAVSSPGFRDRLLSAMHQLSPDERRAVMPFVERAISTTSGQAGRPVKSPIPGHRDSDSLTDAIARRSGPTVAVVSHRLCWTRELTQPFRIQLESSEEFLVIAMPINTYVPQDAA